MTQETLEEAADLWSININNVHPADSYIAKTGFIEGAKWQQQKSYSEEEVRIMLSESFKASQEGYNITSDEIIEQFKNKTT